MQSTDQTLLATVATLSGYCEPTIVIVIFFYWHFKSAVIWSAENIFLWEGKGNYEGRLKFTYILYSLGQRTFYIIICEKSGYLETDIFHEHVQCAYLVPWTIVCEQLQSFSCWLEVVSLFHSIPFPETEFSEKNEVNHELTGSDANARPFHSSFAWLGVKRKILVWIIGVVLGQMVWSASIMCSKVDVYYAGDVRTNGGSRCAHWKLDARQGP